MFFRTVTAIVASILAAGCVSTVSIDAEDEVSFQNLEVSLPAGESSDMRLRLRASRAQGDFSQSLDVGETIRVDDTAIHGSVEVDGELDLDYYSIAIGRDGRFAESGGPWTSMYLGISQTDFDLAISSDRQQAASRDDTIELYLQLGVHARLLNSLDVGLTWASSFGREFSGISEIDLLLEYRLGRNLRLSGGYRWLTYEYGLGDDDSNLEVDFRGPVLGLHVPF